MNDIVLEYFEMKNILHHFIAVVRISHVLHMEFMSYRKWYEREKNVFW